MNELTEEIRKFYSFNERRLLQQTEKVKRCCTYCWEQSVKAVANIMWVNIWISERKKKPLICSSPEVAQLPCSTLVSSPFFCYNCHISAPQITLLNFWFVACSSSSSPLGVSLHSFTPTLSLPVSVTNTRAAAHVRKNKNTVVKELAENGFYRGFIESGHRF